MCVCVDIKNGVYIFELGGQMAITHYPNWAINFEAAASNIALLHKRVIGREQRRNAKAYLQ